MAGDWRAEMKRHMIDVLVRTGAPVRDDPSIYGWQVYEWDEQWASRRKGTETRKQRVERVGIDYVATTYVESCWDEFMGTFYEGDTRVYGVDLHLVLLDGTRLHWRYSGSLSDLITAVLED